MNKQQITQPQAASFGSIAQEDLPHGRNGKHRSIVEVIMADLRNLDAGRALKIPLAQLPDTKENIRSALNRVTRRLGIQVATASDAENLYVWKLEEAAPK